MISNDPALVLRQIEGCTSHSQVGRAKGSLVDMGYLCPSTLRLGQELLTLLSSALATNKRAAPFMAL